jgi:hypothetical protein
MGCIRNDAAHGHFWNLISLPLECGYSAGVAVFVFRRSETCALIFRATLVENSSKPSSDCWKARAEKSVPGE